MMLDESTTKNVDGAPVYVVLCGLTADGHWFMSYVGQADTSGLKGTEEIYTAVKGVVDALCPTLWGRIKAVGTDGCPAMRSTHHYAGPDGNTNAQASVIMIGM